MIPDQIGRVPLDMLDAVWPQVERKLARALRVFGLYTVEATRERVVAGRWELWASLRGRRVVAFGLCEVIGFDTGAALVIHASGADSVEEHNIMWPLIKAYAKARGCRLVLSDSRRGWMRAGKLPADCQHVADAWVWRVA